MRRTSLTAIATGALVLMTSLAALAQNYSNAVVGLNPVGYWPLNETVAPPQPINLAAVNFGTAGAGANGYYGAWYQPSGNTWYLTNNIVQAQAITYPNDGSMAMVCQGAPGQYVIVPRNTNGVANQAVTLNPPFSIEAWLKIGTGVSALGSIVSEGGTVNLNTGGSNTNFPFNGGLGNGWAGVELGQYQDYLFLLCQSTNAVGNKNNELDTSGYNQHKGFAVGQWVHVVATFDTSGKESIWTNGNLCVSKNVGANLAGQKFVIDPTSPLMIGSGSDVTASYGQSYIGTIHDVAIYNQVLSQSSMLNHFQAAFGTNATYGGNYTNSVLADSPVLYYRLNDRQSVTNAGYPSASFPVAANYGSLGSVASGVYQPGTTPGVAGPQFPGFGANSKAVAINGWLGAVDIGNSNIPSQLNPTGTVPMSVVSWFQTGPADAPGRFQEILGHSDSSYRMSLGQVAGECHFNPGPGPELQFTSAASVANTGFAFNDGNWHMIAGVSDGTNEYMYLDGVLAQASSNLVSGINITGTTRDLLLGGDPQYTFASWNSFNTVRNFDGQIAQVAFWTNALNASQIQTLYGAAQATPYFWQEPGSSLIVNQGQNLSVSTGIRGSAPVTYQWYQNGSRVSGQTNATLSYTPAVSSNSGSYILVASNAGGSVTSSVVNVTVYGPPTIQQQTPTQLKIFAGSSPILHVSALGAAPIYYQWTSNSVAIAGATNSSFALSNVQTSATFGCFLTNFVGNASISPIAVTVVTDPTAPFPAQVLADGPTAYFRLDEASGTTAYDYVGGNNATYTNVTLSVPGYDSGKPVQSDPSETAAEFGDYNFTDNGAPDNNFAGNGPTYLNFGTPNGSNAEFSVEAWVTEYHYDNGGNAIVAIGNGGGGEQFVLDTGNLAGGALRFFVHNAAGAGFNANATNQLENDGLWHHVVGVCDEAGGHLYIYLDGKQVGSTTITAGSGLLSSSTPLSIGARQSGPWAGTNYDYQFEGAIDDVAIYNKALTAAQVQNHYLQEGIAPVITGLTPSSNWTTNQSANSSFTVSAAGTAPLSYQWLDNNNNPITGATNSTLTLTNIQPSQAGTYTVNVTNLYGGPVSTNFVLAVTQVPQIISDITPSNVTVYATTPVTLSVTVSGTPTLHYQWYENGVAIVGATNTTYSFAAALGSNNFYLSITNQYSAGSPTVSSTATVTGMPIVTLNPTNYTDNMKITISGYNRSEVLHDFPVLVRFGTNVNYNHFASASGADLRFTDAGGTRVIPSEIDEWNVNGASTVWVQVPQLAGTNTTIYAYWGNASNTVPLSGTNVWVPQSWEGFPSYDVVYHLKEGAFPFVDSTGQNPALTGVAPAQTTGIVGTGAAFDGATSYLDAGNATLSDPFTLSAWVNAVPHNPIVNGIETIWANQPGGFGAPGFAMFVNAYQTTNGDFRFSSGLGNGNGTENGTGAGTVTFNQWHLLSVTVSQSNLLATFFVDGNQVGTTPIKNGFPIAGVDLNLGRFTNSSLYYQGTMDEARIHSGVDSSNWIWAAYSTVEQNASFQSYSTVSTTITNNPGPTTISGASYSGGNLGFVVTGTPGSTFYVVGSTNLTTPFSLWPVVYTNTIGSGGTTSVSLPLDATKPQQFLRIKE